ncbi:alpha/beta fold hydrolase [Alloalcanivorax xenomutans]|uniref:alpha/beta fold hydrolase n=1 Tax=Alloalcanivorax xenomutans TaxID=1094342 RepID=UPI003BAA2B00
MGYVLSGLLIVVILIAAGLFVFTWMTVRKVQFGLPPEGRFVTVMGNRIHYIEQGSGPETLLLIHGLSGVSQHFSYKVLGELAKDYRVVAIDRPGSGYSERAARSSASLVVQADVVAGVIDALQLGKPMLVGHSLGGALSLATALRHPNKVRGLTLIAPLTHMPAAGPSKAFAALGIRQSWLRQLVAWTLMVPMTMRYREKVLDIVFGPETVPADYAIRGGGALGLRPSHFIAASRDLLALDGVVPELQQRYADLQVPVRILYGRGDRILDPREQGQGMVDRFPDKVELELIEGGHMLPLTQPEVTTDFIRRGMRALPPA